MPCSICKKTGHNKKTCTFLTNNIDRTEDILEDKTLQIINHELDNLAIKEEFLENEEIFDNILPKLIVQENHDYHLRDLHSIYIKTTFNIKPKFGDIIQF